MTGAAEDDDRSFREYSRQGGRVSGFAAVMGAVVLTSVLYGTPRMELIVSPIFKSYMIRDDSVARQGQNLCWTREGEKLRNPPLIDIDITVDFISPTTGKLGHQPTPALFFESTGDDFTTEDVHGAGPFRTRVCVRLARSIRPDMPVQVRQTTYFGSITGLWTVPFYVPTIVYPSGSAGIFARHDRAPTAEEASDAVAGPPPKPRPRPQSYDGQGNFRHEIEDLRRVIPEAEVPDAPRTQADPISLDDLLRNDDASGGSVHMDVTLSPADAARVRQSGIANRDLSRRATLRRLIPRALDDEDRDALGPYEPEGK